MCAVVHKNAPIVRNNYCCKLIFMLHLYNYDGVYIHVVILIIVMA